ncbi:hypothetical protein [Cohnella nanjingensis]|uniref:Uncharacterized protein n=1 Tax=Cohnella nanjingensis TaxID=1387779 RepID=A0A7X0RPE2_9BACL|nr:hypothetical protein [Cohnella nanjingensis]MBB6671262.1 hypothetical protein [Cohnella nanjingensis]
MTTLLFTTFQAFWKKGITILALFLGLIGAVVWISLAEYWDQVGRLINGLFLYVERYFSFNKWLELYLFYSILVWSGRFIYGKLWEGINFVIKGLYELITLRLVVNGWAAPAIRIIKWYQIGYLRLNELMMLKQKYYFDNILYSKPIERAMFLDSKAVICLYIVLDILRRWPSIMAALIATILFHKVSLKALGNQIWTLIRDVQISKIGNQIISNIPNLLIVIAAIFILFKLNGSRGILRRTIANANKNKLEEVINEHRQIVSILNKAFIDGVNNLEYIIRNREWIVSTWIRQNYLYHLNRSDHPECSERLLTLLDKKYLGYDDIDFYIQNLTKIPSIDRIHEQLEKNINQFWLLNQFTRLSFKLRGFRLFSSITNNQKNLNMWMLTPDGLTNILDKKKLRVSNIQLEKALRDNNTNKILNVLESNFELILVKFYEEIVQSIEAQVLLLSYANTTNRLLHINADLFGRLSRSLFDREG